MFSNLVPFQSRGGSPLSPFLDHLGSPPPAHMSALRSVPPSSAFGFQTDIHFQSRVPLSFSAPVRRGLRQPGHGAVGRVAPGNTPPHVVTTDTDP